MFSLQVLVLRGERLAGIVTPKDLLMRVVAKGLDPDETPVSSVMTPNPDAVPPTMTAIEALKEVRQRHMPWGNVLCRCLFCVSGCLLRLWL